GFGLVRWREMTGFDVDLAGLRSAAEAAGTASNEARQVHLGDGPTGVPVGMPGSLSASKSGPLAAAWDARVTTWAADIERFGEDLSASAGQYQADDKAAEQDFSPWGWLFG
ncbi:MAG: hypothetical protein ACREX8_07730, partial [Gammaproteobacteria bacterium]